MAGPSRFPIPSEPGMRRLGVGGGGGDRPIRAQIVVAIVALLVLIAVPLYLMRRPTGKENAPKEAVTSAVASGIPASPTTLATPLPTDAGAPPDDRVKNAPVVRVRCGATPSGRSATPCDALPALEELLAKAISLNADCAPRTAKTQTGTVNYVLSVDFTRRSLHVFAGASGSWKGPQGRRSSLCVKKAIGTPPWESISHQHRNYQLAIMTTYQPPSAAHGAPGAPVFE